MYHKIEKMFIIGIKKNNINNFEFPIKKKLSSNIENILESTEKNNKNDTLTKWEINNLQHFIDKFNNKSPPISIEDSYYVLDIGASQKFASIMHNVSCLKASRSNYYITNLQRIHSRECLRLQGIMIIYLNKSVLIIKHINKLEILLQLMYLKLY